MNEPHASSRAGAPVQERAAAPPRAPDAQGGRLLHDWKGAHARVLGYLAALGVPEAERAGLALAAVERAATRDAWAPGSDAHAESLRAVRELLLERTSPAPSPDAESSAGAGFLGWRLAAWLAGTPEAWAPPGAPSGPRALRATPDLVFGHMVPERVERRGLRASVARRLGRGARGTWGPRGGTGPGRRLHDRRRRLPWTRAARRRRALLVFLVLIPSVVASGFMQNVLPHRGSTWLEAAIVLVFGALFGWISIGFWTALLGFVTLLRRDRFAITARGRGRDTALDPAARTALVMPICDEPVDRVFAGLRATHHSLERSGALANFDFFVLSDTRDPGTWVNEEEAWAAWCRQVGGFGRIFYRHRKAPVARKSGNIADFCRRWGRAYRYLVVLDADSVMSGDTLVELVRLMQRNPRVGMIQTAPQTVNRRSLFARVQQFANKLYGPMFAAGLHYWQLGHGQYWGHNAILRVAPFMRHCSLTRLPGRPPWGGEILSHDFVEAALLGRAGWEIWLAFDLDGSFEEPPSTLLEEMKRDRRWCQGNLQHSRLLFSEGLFPAHRALFVNGVMSYVSALLWFGFLALSSAEAISEALRPPDYFPSGRSLFPEWPVWRPDWALTLVAVTGSILFLPKILGILLVLLRGTARQFGGPLRLGASVLFEILLSSLLAPIRMVFHSRFVLWNLLGRTVAWRSQGREDLETSWRAAFAHHGWDTLVASAWGAGVYWLNPDYFWWLTPIVAALILSVPVSVLASRISLGMAARRFGLFVIPEESAPPPELVELQAEIRRARERGRELPPAERDGLVRAVVDPYANAIHAALLGRRGALQPRIRERRRALLRRAVLEGPDALAGSERRVLLADPELASEAHAAVWSIAERERARTWGRPGGD
ncbi:MAG TPA: glucans biosynthesis glucosyltransferase MdoH [Myxococcota bacterium]|nr:glucans biosynthesis glucosyltransferase MdoH [Myxococcota bacterium]